MKKLIGFIVLVYGFSFSASAFYEYYFGIGNIRDMFERDGRIWMATDGGVLVCDTAGETIAHYSLKLTGNGRTPFNKWDKICAGGQDSVWVANYRSLILIDGNSVIEKTYTLASMLKNAGGYISSLVYFDNKIWISTPRQIVFFDIEKDGWLYAPIVGDTANGRYAEINLFVSNGKLYSYADEILYSYAEGQWVEEVKISAATDQHSLFRGIVIGSNNEKWVIRGQDLFIREDSSSTNWGVITAKVNGSSVDPICFVISDGDSGVWCFGYYGFYHCWRKGPEDYAKEFYQMSFEFPWQMPGVYPILLINGKVFSAAHDVIYCLNPEDSSRSSFQVRNLASYDLEENFCHSICRPNDSTVWLGVQRGAIELSITPRHPIYSNFYTVDRGLGNVARLDIQSVLGTKEAVYFGGAGIASYNGNEWHIKEMPYPDSGQLYVNTRDLIEARDGKIWFCYQDGVGQYDPATGQVDLDSIAFNSHSFKDVIPLDDGNFWVTNGTKIFHYNNDQVREYSLYVDWGYRITKDSLGNIWAACNKGAMKYDAQRDEWISWELGGFAYTACRGIFISPDNIPFIATNNGVATYENTWKRFDGLERFDVNYIAFGPNNEVWFATSEGVVLYKPDSLFVSIKSRPAARMNSGSLRPGSSMTLFVDPMGRKIISDRLPRGITIVRHPNGRAIKQLNLNRQR